jgi:protein O-mannosyl-transferase
MASFMLTSWLGGIDSFPFKLGNLLIHLLCGILIWRLGRHAFRLDSRLQPHAELLAVLLTAFWLLHPLHVSTVLYAVQRMAQLSTLFSLAAALLYVSARLKLDAGTTRPALIQLFVGVPVLVIAGILSKQNAAVTPLLCLALEIAYFQQRRHRHRTVLATFYGLFLAAPALAMGAILLLRPQSLLAAYAEWDFTLAQRLLTQPRALWDYIGMLVLPQGSRMGLYTDDFLVSTSLFSPPTTLLAVAALIGVSAFAIAVRKRAPSVFAGWLFFLGAHGVESTFLPIEMYYEHRNYLPSAGLLMALVGLTALVPKTVRTNTFTLRQLGLAGCAGFVLMLAVATLGRVLVWQDVNGISQQAIRFHPNSLRANFDAGDLAVARHDFEYHRQLMLRVAQSPDPRHRRMARMELVYVNCQIGIGGNRALMEQVVSERLPQITVVETYSLMRLLDVSRHRECGDIGRFDLARHVQQLVDAAIAQPESATPKWTARFLLAQLYVSADQWPAALEQAELAWQGGQDKKVGVFLSMAYAQQGDLSEARRMLALVEPRVPAYDRGGQAALARLRSQISQN